MTDTVTISRETLEQVLECLVQEGRSLRAAEVREALEQKAEPPAPKDPVAQWQKRHHRGTEGKWKNTDEHDAKWCRASSSLWDIRALYAAPQAWRPDIGEVVVTRNDAGEIIAVTRQDDEGRILSVIAEAQPAPSQGKSLALLDLDSVEHMQGGANGPTIRLRGFINVQTGPTAPQPPIDNAFVAEGCEQFSQPADIVNPISQQEPVAYRHSKTGQLYDSEEEVPLADGDEWAEPLYAAPVAQQEPSAWRQWSTKQHDWDYQTNRGDLRPDALAEPLFVAAAQPGAIEQALQKIADFGQEQEQKPVAWIGLPGKGTPLFTAPPAPVPPEPIAEMDAVAIRYAHKMALDLECILAEYGGSWYNTAMQTLGEYRSAMNAIHERESPTFMGEPVTAAEDKP